MQRDLFQEVAALFELLVITLCRVIAGVFCGTITVVQDLMWKGDNHESRSQRIPSETQTPCRQICYAAPAPNERPALAWKTSGHSTAVSRRGQPVEQGGNARLPAPDSDVIDVDYVLLSRED